MIIRPLLEDSRKSIAQPPYYHASAISDSNGLAIRGEIETPYDSILVLECVSNTPLRDYPYLEQLGRTDNLLWESQP